MGETGSSPRETVYMYAARSFWWIHAIEVFCPFERLFVVQLYEKNFRSSVVAKEALADYVGAPPCRGARG